MKRFKAILLILSSLALSAVATLTLFSTLRALAVRDTLSAIESAFGSAVVGLLMLALAVHLFRKGRLLLRAESQ